MLILVDGKLYLVDEDKYMQVYANLSPIEMFKDVDKFIAWVLTNGTVFNIPFFNLDDIS